MVKSSAQTVQSTPNSVPPAPPPTKKSYGLLIAVGVIVLLVIFSGGAYYLGTRGVKTASVTTVTNQLPTIPSSPQPTVGTLQTPLLSGQLKKLDQDLKLFKVDQNDAAFDFAYYEAGQFNRGELQGYTRIIALRSPNGPASMPVFTLATKDYQSYFLDDPQGYVTKFPEDNWQNPYNYLDKAKITAAKIFDTDQPVQLNLDQNYSLYSEEISTATAPTSSADKFGNTIYQTLLTTDLSSYQKLLSPFSNLSIYFKPSQQNNTDTSHLSDAEKTILSLRQKYLLGETEVIVTDSTGLPVTYSMTTKTNAAGYPQKLAAFESALQQYNTDLDKFNKKQIATPPLYPAVVYLPNMGFLSTDISNTNNLVFYKNYQTAFPEACATALNSYIVNIKDSDVEQIGTVMGLALYRLKDTKHELYVLAYNNKMDYFNQDPSMWDSTNKGIKQPTLEEYTNNNSVLFVKDYWQRWVALGEYDIQIPGGCGKPVVYLYPAQPTKVTVQFQMPVQLTTDIPTYADYWQVLAHPNGQLANLRPELTDCRLIDDSKKGSEYAKQACAANSYPYLYWAGNVVSKNYPVIDKGWIVEKNNLSGFLENKLTEIGLNSNEKNDFLSYWLPEMLVKNTPYYRISFLQTNDLNLLFPMTVTPNPQTVFRLFLDYSALTAKPQTPIQPQTLNRLVRNGFTLVEWGGWN